MHIYTSNQLFLTTFYIMAIRVLLLKPSKKSSAWIVCLFILKEVLRPIATGNVSFVETFRVPRKAIVS